MADKISSVFQGLRFRNKISEQDVRAAIREIKLALLEADVNYGVVRDFIDRIQGLAVSQEVLQSLTPAQQIVKIVNQELTELLGSQNERINFSAKPPSIVLICGLQGSGKTTHATKLAHHLKAKGKHPMLVACDVYRPAAIEQLKVAGERANIYVFEQGNINPVQIAANSVSYAKDNGYDVIVLDTAGRLQIDAELMDELKKIKKAVKVSETLLVVDSMSGQDAVNAASAFNEAITIDGVILTKLDSDARSGAALSIKAITQKPIKFIGTGEKIADFDVFYPERMASRILGMGDTISLIEKAESAFSEKQKQKMEESLKKNSFDFDDLLANMQTMKKLGSLKNVISLLPGVGNKITDEQIGKSEDELVKTKALISSMTPKERREPALINAGRRKRIAAGSGHKVEDVNRLLKRFEAMNQMMKQFKGNKKRHKKR
ncbi:signal recognition particle protein [Clostridia bacterium]|nr:signal recognition particle protein [Clostridia bacterium]